MRYVLLVFILIAIMSSCKKEGAGTEASKNVVVNTSNIFNKVYITHSNDEILDVLDLGEYELDTGEKPIEINIKNTTAFPMTEIDVVFEIDDQLERAYNYLTDPGNGDQVFPGYGGDCPTVLASGQSCMIVLAIKPAVENGYRIYEQGITIAYKNLIDNDGKQFDIKVEAGWPASLNYQNGDTTFYFGDMVGVKSPKPVVERSEPQSFNKHLTITNNGDLRARNVKVFISDLACFSTRADASCYDLSDHNGNPFENTYVTPAWSLTHNCPKTLKRNESCEADIYFNVLNQNPDGVTPIPESVKELAYSVTAQASYYKNPDYDPAQLNGYFNVVSTTIAAYFESSVEVSEFADTLIPGNRAYKSFIVENTGYRHGLFKKIILSDNLNANAILGYCSDSGIAGGYLECFSDEAMTMPTTLEELPFFVNDKNNCFSSNSESDNFVNVDTGCVFDIYFQPSIQYKDVKEFDIQIAVEYDNRWKALENITQNNLQNVLADSTSAARVVIDSISFGSAQCLDPLEETCESSSDSATYEFQYTPQGTGGSYSGCYDNVNNLLDATISEVDCNKKYHFNMHKIIDLYRLALMSKAYAERTPITITFKNIGPIPALGTSMYYDYLDLDNDKIRAGGTIGDENNKVNIGVDSTAPYYKDVFYSSADCNVISPGSTCSLNISFAPIGLPSLGECAQVKSMFTNENTGANALTLGPDCTNDSDPYGPPAQEMNQLYKMFSIEYDDQSTFSDENLYTVTPDLPKRIVDVKLKSVIVAKGMLAPLSDPSLGKVLGSSEFTGERHILLTNIGTGSIPYIGWDGDSGRPAFKWGANPDQFVKSPFKFVRTANPSLYGAEFDCLEILDFQYDRSDLLSDLQTREDVNVAASGDLLYVRDHWGNGLAAEKSCVLRAEFAAERHIFENQSDHFLKALTSTKPSNVLKVGPTTVDLNEADVGIGTFTGYAIDRFYEQTRLKLEYFDGDSDPSSSFISSLDATDPQKTYGKRYHKDNSSLDEAKMVVAFIPPSFPIVSAVKPMQSAFAYKKGHSVNAISDKNGNVITSLNESVPDYWFWYSSDLLETNLSQAVDVSLYNQGYFSAQNATLKANAASGLASYDYVIDFGTFPVGQSIDLSFNIIKNQLSQSELVLVDEVVGGSSEFTISRGLASEATPSTYKDLDALSGILQTPMVFNAATANTYTGSLTIKYESNLAVDRTCIGDRVACPRKSKTMSIQFIARAIDTYADVTIKEEECVVDYDPFAQTASCVWETQATPTPLDMNTRAPLTTSFNNQGFASLGTHLFETTKLDNPTLTTHFFIKRRYYIKNETSVDATNFNLLFKSSPTGVVEFNLGSLDPKINIDISDCNDEITNKVLPANSSCLIEMTYQPDLFSFSSNFWLYFMYEIDSTNVSGNYVHETLQFSFNPKEPATVIADPAANFLLSGAYPWYDTIPGNGGSYMDSDWDFVKGFPSPYGFTSATEYILSDINYSVTMPSLQLLNQSVTNASFLKAWHTLNGITDKTQVPVPGDYQTVDGKQMVKVYDGNSSFLQFIVYMTEPCLIGDNDAGNPYDEGFNSGSTGNCFVSIELIPNVNASGKNITEADVTGANFTLEYYNNQRLTTSFMGFYFLATFVPNKSDVNTFPGGEYYQNVTAFDDGSVSFEWNPMTETDPLMGAITGYRVFYSDSKSSLNTPIFSYLAGDLTDFEDVSATRNDIQITGLLPGKYKYFKVVPIRESVDYTENLFDGLTGAYLSDSQATTLELVVPPIGYYYEHDDFKLYDKDTTLSGTYSFSDAIAACAGESLPVYKGFLPTYKTMTLIDEPAMYFLMNTPAANDYAPGSSFHTSMHWIAGAPITPDAHIMGAAAQYNYLEKKQDFYSDTGQPYHYYREGMYGSAEYANPLARFYGPYASASDDGVIGLAPTGSYFKLGRARCMVDLSQ